MPSLIPLGRPTIDDSDIEAMSRAARSGRLTLGPANELFEHRISIAVQRPWTVAVSSSATALEIALRALGVGAGDEVIVPAFGYAANVNATIAVGARPLFADVDSNTLCMNAKEVKRCATEKTKAIIAYSPFGSLIGMDAVAQVAASLEIPVIENSTESLGARLGNERAGRFGRMAIVGFGPYRCVSVGEGGAIVTHDDRLAHACRTLRFQGRTDRQSYPDQSPDLGMIMRIGQFGYDARLAEPLAAMGASQMLRLDGFLERRERAATQYFRRLGGHPDLWLPARTDESHPAWHLFPIRLSDNFSAEDRDALLNGLHRHDIGAGNQYPAAHLLPHVCELYGGSPPNCPVAESISHRMITLPMSNDLSIEEVDIVCNTLEILLTQCAARG